MTEEYRPWVPEQSYLLPPSPMDWLPEGHLAYFVLELTERVRETCGSFPELLSADSGYVSESNITYCAAHGIDAYLAVRRKGDDDAWLGRLPMTQARELQWEMHQKVSTPRGRAIYGRRKVIAEPVFGQIKQAMGFPTILAAWVGQGQGRMGDRVPLPQPAQAVPSARRAQAQRAGCLTRRRTPPGCPVTTAAWGCSGARRSCLGSSRGAAALPSNMTHHDGGRLKDLPEGQSTAAS